MKEWFVYFWFPGDDPAEEKLVVLPSHWKLLKWFFMYAHKCSGIYIRLHIAGVGAR